MFAGKIEIPTAYVESLAQTSLNFVKELTATVYYDLSLMTTQTIAVLSVAAASAIYLGLSRRQNVVPPRQMIAYQEDRNNAMIVQLRWLVFLLLAVEILMMCPHDQDPVENGVLVEFWNSKYEGIGTPVTFKEKEDFSYHFGDVSPIPGTVNKDLFTARWRGRLSIPVDGKYHFYIKADDDIGVYIGGSYVEKVFETTSTQQPFDIIRDFKAGDVEIEAILYEYSGPAYFLVEWSYEVMIDGELRQSNKEKIPKSLLRMPTRQQQDSPPRVYLPSTRALATANNLLAGPK